MWNRSCWQCIKLQERYKKTPWSKMRKCVYREKYYRNERRKFRICLVENTGKCPGIYSINIILKCKTGFFMFSRSVSRGPKDFLATGQQYPQILLLSWYLAPEYSTTELWYRHLPQELSSRRSRWPCGLRPTSSASQ